MITCYKKGNSPGLVLLNRIKAYKNPRVSTIFRCAIIIRVFQSKRKTRTNNKKYCVINVVRLAMSYSCIGRGEIVV